MALVQRTKHLSSLSLNILLHSSCLGALQKGFGGSSLLCWSNIHFVAFIALKSGKYSLMTLAVRLRTVLCDTLTLFYTVIFLQQLVTRHLFVLFSNDVLFFSAWKSVSLFVFAHLAHCCNHAVFFL